VPGLDLAELVRRKVAAEPVAMNGRPNQLIAEAVDAELDRLRRRARRPRQAHADRPAGNGSTRNGGATESGREGSACDDSSASSVAETV
jgi:hypothetical protein